MKMFKLTYPNFWQQEYSLISFILLPISYLYLFISRLRIFFAKPISLNSKVICVGNISIGGTGKTQMVLYLAHLLTHQGKKLCIATKGYGRKYRFTKLVDLKEDDIAAIGDEPFLLAQYFPVIVYSNLLELDQIIKLHNYEVVIFDDGMQNPNFYKDYSILMIDGLRGFGNQRLIPAGPLREPISNISKKADLTVIVGADHYHVNKDIKIPKLSASIKPSMDLDQSVNYIAFAGIGNPDKFFNTLSEISLKVVQTLSFPDHYNYTKQDIFRLEELARINQATLLTTEKDWIKLETLKAGPIIFANHAQNLVARCKPSTLINLKKAIKIKYSIL